VNAEAGEEERQTEKVDQKSAAVEGRASEREREETDERGEAKVESREREEGSGGGTQGCKKVDKCTSEEPPPLPPRWGGETSRRATVDVTEAKEE
jgi:hypothetical protein